MKIDLNDPRIAAEIQRLVDRRIESTRRNKQTHHQYGVVEGAADTAKRTVSVRLYGMAEPTPGFVYSYGLVPRDGDHVRVYIDPRGDHWIDAIQGRDVVSEIIDASHPPAPDSPIDRGLGATAQVMVSAGSGTLGALVRQSSPVHGSLTIPMGGTPTDGDLLVLVVWSTQRTNTPATIAGWTLAAAKRSGVSGPGGAGSTFIYYRVAAGEASSIVLANYPAIDCLFVIAEYSGFAGVAVADTSSTETAFGTAIVAPGAVIVPSDGLVVTSALISEGNGHAYGTLTPDAAWTTRLNVVATYFVYANYWGDRVVAAGTYSPSGTMSTTDQPSGSVAVAFVATAVDYLVPAPETVDGDDVTYHAGQLAEAVRLDLGGAYRIVRARVRIGCSTAGLKTYELRAANAPDFSDEVTVATQAFTSAGSYAAQDATYLWTGTTSYRYFRLVGPAEARRIFTIEMYEQAPNTPIVTDPGSGAGTTIDAALAALLAEIGSHLHDASWIDIADAGGFFAALNVETALQELASKDIGYTAHGNTGATETFDAAVGWHSATLNANCTLTLTGATTGLVAALVLELHQDATGSRLVTWPASVVWPGGSAPMLATAANAVDVITLFSRDGGTTWYGFPTGGSSGITVKDEGSALATLATFLDFVGAGVVVTGTGATKTITIPGVATLDDLTDVVITAPAAGDRIRYSGSAFVNSPLRWEPHVSYDGTVVLDGNGDPVMQEVSY